MLLQNVGTEEHGGLLTGLLVHGQAVQEAVQVADGSQLGGGVGAGDVLAVLSHQIGQIQQVAGVHPGGAHGGEGGEDIQAGAGAQLQGNLLQVHGEGHNLHLQGHVQLGQGDGVDRVHHALQRSGVRSGGGQRDHHMNLIGFLSGIGGGVALGSFCALGGRLGVGLLAAAGQHARNHQDTENDAQYFLHAIVPPFFFGILQKLLFAVLDEGFYSDKSLPQ